MLDRIQNNGLDSINQGQTLDKILSVGATNPFETEDVSNLLVDESDISMAAFKKYQRELDIEKFSAILKETDEQEANNLVLKGIFRGDFNIENDEIFNSIVNNNDFLYDIFE